MILYCAILATHPNRQGSLTVRRTQLPVTFTKNGCAGSTLCAMQLLISMELPAVALGSMEVLLSYKTLTEVVRGSYTAVAMGSSTRFMARSVISAD